MRVVGKMSGHPVEPYGEPLAMAGIDECGKILRRTEPAGGGVETCRLIAPGAVERMFADGEKLDVGEAEIFCIGGKLLGEVAIGQPLIAVLAPPRAEMDLEDRDRRAQRIHACWRGLRLRNPAFIDDDRCRA